eukprot:PhM_4_TR7211/c0_g1_i1/m.89949
MSASRNMMRAITHVVGANRDALRMGTVLRPTVQGPNDVLVRVQASGVNHVDVRQRCGEQPPPEGASDILGIEVSGVVEEVGSAVGMWSAGDEVMGLVRGGGYAEYVVCHEGHMLRRPSFLSAAQGAAVPEAFLTAHQCMGLEYGRHGGIKPGDVALIHAGAGGVGSAAIQLCKLLGVKPIATCSDGKASFCHELGAVVVAVDRMRTRSGGETLFADEVLRHAPEGVNFILDPNFASYYSENVRVLGMDGTIVVISFLGGNIMEKFNAVPLMLKRGRMSFTTLRQRDDEYKTRLVHSFEGFLGDFVPHCGCTEPALRPMIHEVLDARHVARAHELVETHSVQGKVVLTWD